MAETSADTRGWGSGFPADRRRDMARVCAGGATVWVHREITAVVAHLLEETARRGYQLREGECWGYCCRAIRGLTKPSNHSWGLAVDLNSTSNPMGSELKTDMADWMPKLWGELGFRWGGAYPGRKDAMHYEFMGTPAEARALAAGIGHSTPVPARRGSEEKERFMYDPPLVMEPIVASMAWPGGGSLLLAASGAVYAFDGATFLGAANGKDYFVGRRAARLEKREDREGYAIVATSGERYLYP